MVTRVRILLAALLFAATTAPAPARHVYDVLIENPLPNRVWVTIYHNASIHWYGWVTGSMRYQTNQGSFKIMAEVARLNDNSVHPAIVCKTDMSLERWTKTVTIHYTPGKGCFWQPR